MTSRWTFFLALLVGLPLGCDSPTRDDAPILRSGGGGGGGGSGGYIGLQHTVIEIARCSAMSLFDCSEIEMANRYEIFITGFFAASIDAAPHLEHASFSHEIVDLGDMVEVVAHADFPGAPPADFHFSIEGRGEEHPSVLAEAEITMPDGSLFVFVDGDFISGIPY